MKNDDERVIDRLRTWCPNCGAKLKIKMSYPFYGRTMRIDIDCNYYSRDDHTGKVWRCNWDGICMELGDDQE